MLKNKLFLFIRNSMFNRKVITFLLCLVIASFFWLINALNRNYTRTITVPLKFINLPSDRVLANELPKSFHVDIKASGIKLLFLTLKENLNVAVIDLNPYLKKSNKDIVAIGTSTAVGSLSKILNTEIETIKVKPDSIYLNFGASYKKIVPIKPILNINFDPLYNLTDKVRITPPFVTITGDSVLLSMIDSIETEKIVLNKLNQNINQQANLEIPEELNSRIALSITKVNLSIIVDKFTESTIEIPIEKLNIPNHLSLKTFPATVTIKFNVPLGEYEKSSALDFKVWVDYKELKEGMNILPVHVLSKVVSYKITRFQPEKVEYLIKK